MSALVCMAWGCKDPASAPASGSSGQSGAAIPELGWVGWFGKAPKEAQAAAAHEGFQALYRRRYREAIQAFATGADKPHEQLALARAHFRLGLLNRALARLLSEVYLRYFDSREKLGAQVVQLKKSRVYRARALRVLGRAKEAAKLGPDPARPAWLLGPCEKAPKVLSGAAAKNEDLVLWHAALCAPVGQVDVQSLREATQAPADEEEIKASESLSTTFEYYDPIANRMLATYHLRSAQAVLEALDSNTVPLAPLLAAHVQRARGATIEAPAPALEGRPPTETLAGLIFSPWANVRGLAESLQPNLNKPDEQLQEMRTALGRSRKALSSMSKEGQQIITELGLLSAPFDGRLRALGRGLLEKGQCPKALEVLRSSAGAQTKISFRNEPSFLVEFAAAAVCMRRSAEAIGALRAVRAAYPEAAGALAATRSLVVSRVMGGTSSAQETQ